jgi:hypothetical protein
MCGGFSRTSERYGLGAGHWKRHARTLFLVALILATWVLPAGAQTDQSQSAPAATDDSGSSTGAPTTEDAFAEGSVEAAAASSSFDDTPGAALPREAVRDSNGSFTQSIGIAVPPFHGLEPALALTYDSSRDNGFVGVGWDLDGLSVIERATPGFGAPRYSTTDIYVLDGTALVACTAAMTSPSCTTGGTITDYFVTRIESYLRIKRNTAANTWEVWARNGTKLTYRPAGFFAGGDTSTLGAQFRWLLASVVDTHGNTLQYSYVCPVLPDCLIDAITYNGNTVKFYRETRPDPYSYATGAGLGAVGQRLKSIDVQVDGQRVRAYALTYGTGTSTNRSRLASVQQFGRDASVDPSGTVSGVTSLPPVTLVASDLASHSFTRTSWGAGHGRL